MHQFTPRKRQPHVCMRCAAQDVRIVHRSDVLDFKGLTIEVDGLAATVCNACGYEWTTEGQEADNLQAMRDAFAHKRDQIRASEGLLTGEQIKQAIEMLGLSRAEAASLFGGGPNAFGKYISGEVLQSFAMDRLIRLTVGFGEHALRLLRKGRQAELKLNSGGHFVSAASATPTISGVHIISNATSTTAVATTSPTMVAHIKTPTAAAELH